MVEVDGASARATKTFLLEDTIQEGVRQEPLGVIRVSSLLKLNQSVITQALPQPLLDAGIALDLRPVF